MRLALVRPAGTHNAFHVRERSRSRVHVLDTRCGRVLGRRSTLLALP